MIWTSIVEVRGAESEKLPSSVGLRKNFHDGVSPIFFYFWKQRRIRTPNRQPMKLTHNFDILKIYRYMNIYIFVSNFGSILKKELGWSLVWSGGSELVNHSVIKLEKNIFDILENFQNSGLARF